MSEAISYKLADGWKEASLDDLVASDSKITYGVVQPGNEVEEGVPFIRGGDIYNGRISVDSLRTISKEISSSYKRTLLNGGEIVMSLVGYPGEVAVVPYFLAGANIARQAAYIKLDGVVDSKYVMYYLQSDLGRFFLFQKSTGSAQQVINLAELKAVKVIYPPLLVQEKIAHILTAVDNLIEKNQALIDKYTAVKQGMMHDLFTRGIDLATGQLRPSYEQAPELYKETELGWVPREWETCRLGEKIIKIEQGWSPDCDSEPAVSGNWGVLKTTAVVWEGYSAIENKALPLGLSPRPEYEVRAGDVLITRAGPGSRVGVVAYVDETQQKLMLSDKLYRVLTKNSIDKRFLSLLLSSTAIQRQFDATKTGLAESQSNISQEIVKNLFVCLPELNEQIAFVDRLTAVSASIKCQLSVLDKLRVQKKGLMQDLLTGRVRVS